MTLAKIIAAWLVVAAVIIGIPVAYAGHCHHLYQAHHVQAVAVVQPLYFAGAATEQESIVRKVVREELRQALQAQPQQQQQAQPQDYASTLLQKSVMVQKCNKCHSSDGTRLTNPDGTLDPMKFRAFARMAGLGKDIPDQMKAVIASLTPEEKGNITEALLALPPATEQKKTDGTLE